MTKQEFNKTKFHNGMKVEVENKKFAIRGVDFGDGTILIKAKTYLWMPYEICRFV